MTSAWRPSARSASILLLETAEASLVESHGLRLGEGLVGEEIRERGPTPEREGFARIALGFRERLRAKCRFPFDQ